MSLWHKIFGSPEQQTQKIVEISAEAEQAPPPASPRYREERHGDEGHRDERHDRHRDDGPRDRGGRRPAREDLGPTPDDVFIDSPDPSIASDSGDRGENAGAESDDGRKRRPRRRRGGRGRKRETTGGAEAGPEGAAEDRPPRREGEAPRRDDRPRHRDDRDRGPRREPRRPAARQERVVKDDHPHEDDFDTDDFLDLGPDDEQMGDLPLNLEGDEGDSADGGAPAGHRSIPTWDEAIGIIVDVNLATRTDRRRSGPNNGPSRGRPRGGRRRKSS